MNSNAYIVLVAFVGGNLLFMGWLWFRARPESGDALFLPPMILLSLSMLIGLLPRLLWPNSDSIQIGASIASIILTIAVTVTIIRRNRRLRQGRRPQ